MLFKDFQSIIRQAVGDNASTLLTAAGVVGTATTAILAGRAAVKAHVILEVMEKERVPSYNDYKTMKEAGDDPRVAIKPPLSKTDKALATAPVFIPPAVAGGLTIGSIILANRVNAARAATLAAAYGVSQTKLEEYQAKLAEKLSGPKHKQAEEEIAQDRVNRHPPKEVIILAEGDVLCFDMATGRYFRCSVEKLRKAESTINRRLADCSYASLTEFYDEIGLDPTTYSDSVGWSTLQMDAPFELKLEAVKTPDGEKPCLALDFNVMPHPEYTRSY